MNFIIVWLSIVCDFGRLAGATLVAPVVNYWLPGFPNNLAKEAYYEQLPQDQWAVGVAHYTPWLTYWWNTQKWFPASSVIAQKPKLSPPDVKILTALLARHGRTSKVLTFLFLHNLEGGLQPHVLSSFHACARL